MTPADRPADLPGTGIVLERPKVFYNATTGKFVMYVHLDDSGYRAAEVGVAISDSVDGDYRLLAHFRPLDQQSRDIGQFIDDDGTAYLIFEDRPKGWHIAKLSDDYLSIERDVHLFPQHMEGGALVHLDGLYYAIGSHLTGWAANPNLYATARSLEGPWSEFTDVAPPKTKTYGSQSAAVRLRRRPRPGRRVPDAPNTKRSRRAVRRRVDFGDIAVPIGRRHAAIHEEVAAGDEPALGAHEQRAHCSDLVGRAGPPGHRAFDHAPVTPAARARQLVLRERRHDDPRADRIDSSAAPAPAHRLGHHAQRVATLRDLVRVQRILDLIELHEREREQLLRRHRPASRS